MVLFRALWHHFLMLAYDLDSKPRRPLLAMVLIVAALLVIPSSSEAASPVTVVLKVLPGVNLPLISNLLGGTVIDSVPDANTYLLKVPALPVLTPAPEASGCRVDRVEPWRLAARGRPV